MSVVEKRTDFIWVFDVTNGNPNGDPDANNQPRINTVNGHGLVSDVSLKRKIRDYVLNAKGQSEGYQIYVTENAILTDKQKMIYESPEFQELTAMLKGKSDHSKKEYEIAASLMCKHFYDVRTFGAVMSTTLYNSGQVRGPVQLTFAESVDPIPFDRKALTRCAVTNEREAGKNKENRTMGAKYQVPYGLYVAYGFVNPFDGRKTGFSQEDWDLFLEAANRCFDYISEASHGKMSTKKIYLFEHENDLGFEKPDKLFKAVKIYKKEGVDIPKSYDDYILEVDERVLDPYKGKVSLRIIE